MSNLRMDRALVSKLRELKAAGGVGAADKSKWVKIGDMFVDLAAPPSEIKVLPTSNGFNMQFYPAYRITVKKQVRDEAVCWCWRCKPRGACSCDLACLLHVAQIVGPEAVCIQRRYKPVMKETVAQCMRKM